MSTETTAVRFLTSWTPPPTQEGLNLGGVYHAGEVAGFPAHIARDLIARRIAVAHEPDAAAPPPA